MEHLPLPPAAQAVLQAVIDLGQGNVHELAERSGKARSTTDKAIKTLADAGVIVAVDTAADPAEGTPTRWTLSETAAAELAAADPTETDDNDPEPIDDQPDPADAEQPDHSGDDHSGDAHPVTHTGSPGDETSSTPATSAADANGKPDNNPPAEPQRTVAAPTRPGDRKVMTIKGVLADHSDGATIEEIVAESGISHPTTVRLLAAMEQADAARRMPGQPDRWITGPTKASEVDPNPEPPRCPLCVQVIRAATSSPDTVAAVRTLIRPDGALHILGPDDSIHVVTMPTQRPTRPANSLRTPAAPGGRDINTDGNEPFGRGELEKLSIAALTANPGQPMGTKEIAAGISAAHGGRAVSEGAVRNNCTKAAASGHIQLASESPLRFVYLPPAGPGDKTEAPPTGPASDDPAPEEADAV